MAITFHPDGRVTGNKITQSGMVLQVINSLNTYPHTFTGTQNTEYTVESASGTSWETSITINQGNKVHAIISLMVGKQGDANTYYDLYFNVDGGSYAKTINQNWWHQRQLHGQQSSSGHLVYDNLGHYDQVCEANEEA